MQGRSLNLERSLHLPAWFLAKSKYIQNSLINNGIVINASTRLKNKTVLLRNRSVKKIIIVIIVLFITIITIVITFQSRM